MSGALSANNNSTSSSDTSASASGSLSASTTGSADISTRITEWRLTPAQIQADIDSGTAIVRTKDNVVGAPTGNSDDAVVKTMVKGRIQADAQLSAAASDIDVGAHNGEVTLNGKVQSADQVGRAIALALNTEGVTKVTSELKLSTAQTQ
jgi:hypothetical protein